MTRQVDDELVILDVSTGRYFGLNDVGAAVWDRLERDATQDDLVDAVVESFDVDRDEAARDIDELVGDLVSRGLVDLQP